MQCVCIQAGARKQAQLLSVCNTQNINKNKAPLAQGVDPRSKDAQALPVDLWGFSARLPSLAELARNAGQSDGRSEASMVHIGPETKRQCRYILVVCE